MEVKPKERWSAGNSQEGKPKDAKPKDDGFAVSDALVQLQPLQWVTIRVEIMDHDIKITDLAENDNIFVRVHLLGWSYDLALPGDQQTLGIPSFCEASVPVASEEPVALDSSELGIEVFQVSYIYIYI